MAIALPRQLRTADTPTLIDRAGHWLIRDPVTGRNWRVPRRRITSVDAEVSERWVANCVVPQAVARALVPPSFLELDLVDGQAVLSLCAIFMRHAAPCWAPLRRGPGSHNCALRIACRDRRTDEPVVWVDQRYSDSRFAPVLRLLGFPPVLRGLTVAGSHAEGWLNLRSNDGVIDCRLAPALPTAQAPLFTDATAFGAYFGAGVRSYGPCAEAGRYAVVDLVKRSDNSFQHCVGLGGGLRTPAGDWLVESVYRTVDGLYRWTHDGYVDDCGEKVP